MKLSAVRNAVAAVMLGALGALLVAAPARAETIQVKIQNLGFAPQHVSAHVGDTIEWINADFVAHTATARNGAWDVMIPANASKSVVVKAAGTVDYYCKFHPTMTGTLDIAQ